MPTVMERPTFDSTLREAFKIRSVVTDAVEDGVRSASHAIQQGRQGAEDMLDDVKHTVKQRPLQTMGIAFAVGALAGGLLGVLPGVVVSRHCRIPWPPTKWKTSTREVTSVTEIGAASS